MATGSCTGTTGTTGTTGMTGPNRHPPATTGCTGSAALSAGVVGGTTPA
jgi:hypothetical protein